MATVNALVDNALMQARGSSDHVFSTPTLQAAISGAPQGSHRVHVCSANGWWLAGAGQSGHEPFLPNVTGVEFTSAFEPMLALMKKVMPSARRIGNHIVPAEVTRSFIKISSNRLRARLEWSPSAFLRAPAPKFQMPALAMAGRGIDAMCQIPGNSRAAAFAQIARAAKSREKYRFSRFPDRCQAHEGAASFLPAIRSPRDAGKCRSREVSESCTSRPIPRPAMASAAILELRSWCSQER